MLGQRACALGGGFGAPNRLLWIKGALISSIAADPCSAKAPRAGVSPKRRAVLAGCVASCFPYSPA